MWRDGGDGVGAAGARDGGAGGGCVVRGRRGVGGSDTGDGDVGCVATG